MTAPVFETEQLVAYIPMDRRQALARGEELPEHTVGAALFADVSGFTPLTEALAKELGHRRGAEELTRHLNLVYDALITELHRFRGCVIGFSGDAITCWLDGDDGLRATACALAMQQVMDRFRAVKTPSGSTLTLAIKVAVSVGPARRFLVGDPEIQVIDVMAGTTIDRLATAEKKAKTGEVVLDQAAVEALGDRAQIAKFRQDKKSDERFSVVVGLAGTVTPDPWPPPAPDALSPDLIRPWLLPPVYTRLSSGQGEFLAELRPAVPLFLRFTGIDYDRDPAAGQKLDTFIRQVQRTLLPYEGSLIQLTIGDKGSYLYAAFGAPFAHEDEETRATSAALQMRSIPATLKFIEGMQIGISKGRMRTGAYGGNNRRTYGVLGDEVNLAARVMSVAKPGQILVTKAVKDGTFEAFEWKSLPAIPLKGKSKPVRLFSLRGTKRRRTVRLREARYALPMVGREAERELISQKIALAIEGRGQIAGITAEAGMGKSRLLAEVIRLASGTALVGYSGECQSYGTTSSYLVWQNILQDFFELNPDWSAKKRIQALERQLRQVDPQLVARMPLLGGVLNLPIPENDLTSAFDAKLRKSSLEALLLDALRARAKTTPLLFILEDCHWLDPLSHDLLEVFGRAIADLPVFIAMAYRPPDLQRWTAPLVSGLPHFTEIELSEFGPEEAQSLIRLKLRQLFGKLGDAPMALFERITARAEGNPFYIEELLNYLQDRGIDPHDDRALLELDLPTSLHSLILTRIDQLTENQKITLKVASVIGRLFRAAMLWGVYPQLGQSERVRADLDRLCQLELTILDTPEPELAYIFKNIVTQEVAYESLPFATRSTLHEQIGFFIERTTGPDLKQYVDLLAYHFDKSQNDDKKREYLLKAGEAAQADYANQVAIDYYQRLLPLLPENEKVPVFLKLGAVMELVGQWQEADELYGQALAIAERLEDLPAKARCQTAKGQLLMKQGLYPPAFDWLEQARTGFEDLDDPVGIGQVLHYEGTLAAQQGDYERAEDLYGRSLTIRQKLGDKANQASIYGNLGIIARFRGDYASASDLHEESLSIRRELGDKLGIAHSLNNLGNVHLDQSDYEGANSRLEEALAIRREVGDKWAIANTLNNLGNVIRAQGDFETAQSLYNESLSINLELGDRWSLAYLLEDIGVLSAQRGEAHRAMRLIGAAEKLREEIGAPRSPAEVDKLEQLLAPARESLGDTALEASESAGRALSLDHAIAQALNAESI